MRDELMLLHMLAVFIRSAKIMMFTTFVNNPPQSWSTHRWCNDEIQRQAVRVNCALDNLQIRGIVSLMKLVST